MGYENKISITLDISFDSIDEIKWNRDHSRLTINMKDKTSFNILGDNAMKVYKTLCRNYSGEHLD